MSGLLPDSVRDAITARGDYGASASFGVVVLVVLLVLLVEQEVLRVAGPAPSKPRLTPIFAATTALSIAVVLTIAVRVGDLL
jgi:hypothetical protein